MNDLIFKPKAFLFDLNGTMINDMKYHALAWHAIITMDIGREIAFEDVQKEMYGKNAEVLDRIFGENHFSLDEVTRLSIEKEKQYRAGYLPHLALLDGLDRFLTKAKENHIQMAIGSAAILDNIDFVLDGLNVRSYFNAIVGAENVVLSKPHPETFTKAATALNVAPEECLVFEDAPKGVEAALNAGMKCLVLTTEHGEDAFRAYPNVVGFVKDYTDPLLNTLFTI
ncbi:HAD family hydrolase [Pedobacter sp. MW01-1-1]|uniref:HAD family hydrolase n=1 Tax=Pedobacter sp. MW01-1-1 TaxID=3383027 RepID=UPI003FEEA1D4